MAEKNWRVKTSSHSGNCRTCRVRDANASLTAAIKVFVNMEQKNWDNLLPDQIYAINTYVQSTKEVDWSKNFPQVEKFISICIHMVFHTREYKSRLTFDSWQFWRELWETIEIESSSKSLCLELWKRKFGNFKKKSLL